MKQDQYINSDPTPETLAIPKPKKPNQIMDRLIKYKTWPISKSLPKNVYKYLFYTRRSVNTVVDGHGNRPPWTILSLFCIIKINFYSVQNYKYLDRFHFRWFESKGFQPKIFRYTFPIFQPSKLELVSGKNEV